MKRKNQSWKYNPYTLNKQIVNFFLQQDCLTYYFSGKIRNQWNKIESENKNCSTLQKHLNIYTLRKKYIRKQVSSTMADRSKQVTDQPICQSEGVARTTLNQPLSLSTVYVAHVQCWNFNIKSCAAPANAHATTQNASAPIVTEEAIVVKVKAT